MSANSRREFLAEVGSGMLIASLGATLATDLGLARLHAAESKNRLSFGELDPLVGKMQDTPLDSLIPTLVKEIKQGTSLSTLVTAGALANARTFGGQDYTGYHTFMALVPAYQMSTKLSAERKPLPVLKVLYRNTARIHEQGGAGTEVLEHLVAEHAGEIATGSQLQSATRSADMAKAEAMFAGIVAGAPDDAFNRLMYAVQDEVDVHRVVLAWRAWAMMDMTGPQFAHTFLRQSVRYCVQSEQNRLDRGRGVPEIRTTLVKLLDQYRLESQPVGTRMPDDAWVDQMAKTIYGSSRQQAAEAVAAALADGIHPQAIAEAMCLAANLLVLHDPGRKPEHSTAQKPAGCVHGDSVGVHASDAANAWRQISRVADARNTVASLIVGAFHTAGQASSPSAQSFTFDALAEELRREKKDAAALLSDLESAVRQNQQAQACAIAQAYGNLGYESQPVFDLLLKYAVSEDGALHAEKYFSTVSQEFQSTRPAFRWRQLVALARVTASEHGYAAPGYAESCRLLGVS